MSLPDWNLDPPEDDDEFDGEEIEPDFEGMIDDGPFEDRDCDYWNGVT